MSSSKDIYINRVQCTQCNTVAVSLNRHHLQFCKCGAVFADGGQDYLRRGGDPICLIDKTVYRIGGVLFVTGANNERLYWASANVPAGLVPHCPLCGRKNCNHVYHKTELPGLASQYEFAIAVLPED